MIYNQKCDECAFSVKCVAKNKMKPFTADARTDLGVNLEFIGCNDFVSMDNSDEENDN